MDWPEAHSQFLTSIHFDSVFFNFLHSSCGVKTETRVARHHYYIISSLWNCTCSHNLWSEKLWGEIAKGRGTKKRTSKRRNERWKEREQSRAGEQGRGRDVQLRPEVSLLPQDFWYFFFLSCCQEGSYRKDLGSIISFCLESLEKKRTREAWLIVLCTRIALTCHSRPVPTRHSACRGQSVGIWEGGEGIAGCLWYNINNITDLSLDQLVPSFTCLYLSSSTFIDKSGSRFLHNISHQLLQRSTFGYQFFFPYRGIDTGTRFSQQLHSVNC